MFIATNCMFLVQYDLSLNKKPLRKLLKEICCIYEDLNYISVKQSKLILCYYLPN